jgi:hypothetical protein
VHMMSRVVAFFELTHCATGNTVPDSQHRMIELDCFESITPPLRGWARQAPARAGVL